MTQMKSLSRLSVGDNYISEIPDFSNTTTLHFIHL